MKPPQGQDYDALESQDILFYQDGMKADVIHPKRLSAASGEEVLWGTAPQIVSVAASELHFTIL